MGQKIHIDASELTGLGRDLAAVPAGALVETRKVLQKGALNIKKDAQRRSGGIAHAPLYPYTITYDSHETVTGGWAEIGPDPDKQLGGGPHRTPGNLGAILEYGTPRNAPIPHLAPALEAEEPRFVKAIGDVAVKATGL